MAQLGVLGVGIASGHFQVGCRQHLTTSSFGVKSLGLGATSRSRVSGLGLQDFYL